MRSAIVSTMAVLVGVPMALMGVVIYGRGLYWAVSTTATTVGLDAFDAHHIGGMAAIVGVILTVIGLGTAIVAKHAR